MVGLGSPAAGMGDVSASRKSRSGGRDEERVVRTRRMTLISLVVTSQPGMVARASPRSGLTRRSALRSGDAGRSGDGRSRVDPVQGTVDQAADTVSDTADTVSDPLPDTAGRGRGHGDRHGRRRRRHHVRGRGYGFGHDVGNRGCRRRRHPGTSCAGVTDGPREATQVERPTSTPGSSGQERQWARPGHPQPDLPAGMGPARRRRTGRWSSSPPAERPCSRHAKARVRPPTSARTLRHGDTNDVRDDEPGRPGFIGGKGRRDPPQAAGLHRLGSAHLGRRSSRALDRGGGRRVPRRTSTPIQRLGLKLLTLPPRTPRSCPRTAGRPRPSARSRASTSPSWPTAT